MSRTEPWPHAKTDFDAPHDLKAGWSTICRAGNHRTCAQLQARCVCDCHGRDGQEPPTPQPQERPVMSEATVTPLPTKPSELREHRCSQCDRTFASPNGVLIHRARAHADKAPKTTPPPMAERPTPKPAPATKAVKAARAATPKHVERQAVADRDLLRVLALAYFELNGAEVDCAIDSAASLIDALAANGWMVVET